MVAWNLMTFIIQKKYKLIVLLIALDVQIFIEQSAK